MVATGSAVMNVDTILEEIRTMAKLDHPNVVRVYEFFEESEQIFQIMELLTGGSLQGYADKIHREGGHV